MTVDNITPVVALTFGDEVKVSFLVYPGWLVRTVVDFGFAAIDCRGIEDCEELFEGFRLHEEEVVRHTCFSFALVEDEAEGRIVYRDKQTEVRMSREEYDAASKAMTLMVPDARVQRMLTGVYEALAAFQNCERPMVDA